MCQEVFEYIVVVLGKYLQMMVAFHIFKEDLEKVILQFKQFNTLHTGMCEVFLAVTNDSFHPGALRKQKAKAHRMPRENLPALRVSVEASLELGQFLRSNKLTELGELLTRAGMTLEDVLTLDDQEMTDLGIGTYRLRKILLTAIRNHQTPIQNISIVDQHQDPSSGFSEHRDPPAIHRENSGSRTSWEISKCIIVSKRQKGEKLLIFQLIFFLYFS